MQLPIATASVARGDSVTKTSVALMLAAALAAGGAHAAETATDKMAGAVAGKVAGKVERDDAVAHDKADLDAKLEEAQERLQKAATEVAAISAELAGRVVENITSSLAGMPRRTVIGVQLEPGTNATGAKVQQVSPGGPAEQAGIRAGDVIVSINGTAVKGEASREVVRLLRAVPPDTKVKVRVMREGKPRDFDVVARPFDARTFVYRTDPPPGFHPSPSPSPSYNYQYHYGPYNYSYSFANDLQGMELTTLTPQLGKYFGADTGVLVVRAPQNETFKLQDGDVIMNVDGRVPNSGSHLTRILRSYQPGEKLVMRIMRDRKPLQVQVTVPDTNRMHGSRRTRARFLGEDHQVL
jgi:S1-C subfamily serine protease